MKIAIDERRGQELSPENIPIGCTPCFCCGARLRRFKPDNTELTYDNNGIVVQFDVSDLDKHPKSYDEAVAMDQDYWVESIPIENTVLTIKHAI